jgi:hypothetical protein
MDARKGHAVFRIGRLVVSIVVMAIALPLASSAQGTPEAMPEVGCAFPPISIELLREIRDDVAENSPPTPTVYADGSWSSRMHTMPFPPPPGEPLDDETVTSVQQFLADYETCLVIGDIPTTYGAWSEGFIRRTVGDNLEFIEGLIDWMESGSAVWLHPGIDLLLLRAWSIETGHVVAVVELVGTQETWTMLLQPAGETWLIDELWSDPLQLLDDSLTGPVYGTPIADDSLIETDSDSATTVPAD